MPAIRPGQGAGKAGPRWCFRALIEPLSLLGQISEHTVHGPLQAVRPEISGRARTVDRIKVVFTNAGSLAGSRRG